jgi:hypothetical protein
MGALSLRDLEGTVNLTPRRQDSRLEPSSLACERDTGRIAPRIESALAGGAVLTGGEAMTAELEVVVDRSVGGEELLRLPG